MTYRIWLLWFFHGLTIKPVVILEISTLCVMKIEHALSCKQWTLTSDILPLVAHKITQIATYHKNPAVNWVSDTGWGYRKVPLLAFRLCWRNSSWHFCDEPTIWSGMAILLAWQKQHYQSHNYFRISYWMSFTVNRIESGHRQLSGQLAKGHSATEYHRNYRNVVGLLHLDHYTVLQKSLLDCC